MAIATRTIIREQTFPFKIKAKADPFYSKENQAVLRRSIAQLEAGKGTVHELIEVEDA